jgi:hypothetical protein
VLTTVTSLDWLSKLILISQGLKNYKNFKQTMKRLEDMAVTSRGEERVQLLRRWLVALKELEASSGDEKNPESSDENDTSPKNVSPVRLFCATDLFLKFQCFTVH